eukprot:2946926-Amphidinium_carterae.1
MFAVAGTGIGVPGRNETGIGENDAGIGVGSGSGGCNPASSCLLAAAAATQGLGPEGSPQD